VKHVAVIAAAIALCATGFLVACGDKTADSDAGTPANVADPESATVTVRWTLTFSSEEPSP